MISELAVRFKKTRKLGALLAFGKTQYESPSFPELPNRRGSPSDGDRDWFRERKLRRHDLRRRKQPGEDPRPHELRRDHRSRRQRRPHRDRREQGSRTEGAPPR